MKSDFYQIASRLCELAISEWLYTHESSHIKSYLNNFHTGSDFSRGWDIVDYYSNKEYERKNSWCDDYVCESALKEMDYQIPLGC
jgi:hypothetical protein